MRPSPTWDPCDGESIEVSLLFSNLLFRRLRLCRSPDSGTHPIPSLGPTPAYLYPSPHLPRIPLTAHTHLRTLSFRGVGDSVSVETCTPTPLYPVYPDRE